jgi:hypothetical protein
VVLFVWLLGYSRWLLLVVIGRIPILCLVIDQCRRFSEEVAVLQITVISLLCYMENIHNFKLLGAI